MSVKNTPSKVAPNEVPVVLHVLDHVFQMPLVCRTVEGINRCLEGQNYSAAPSARGTCAPAEGRSMPSPAANALRIVTQESSSFYFEDWPYILHIVHWMDRIYKRVHAGNAKGVLRWQKPLKMDCRQAYYYTMPCSPGLSYSSFSWLRA